MICERSFCKHGRKRSVPLREQSGLGIFCAHSRFIMRGQTVYTVVSFIFFLHFFILLDLFSSWSVVIFVLKTELFIKQI